MSLGHPCWMCWPCPQFLECLWDILAGYAGHASNSPNVFGTSLLDMLAMLTIPPMSGKHLGWICWPCLQFTQCLWDIPAGYAGHAYNYLNAFGTQFLECLWDIPAGYACCGTHLAPDPRIIVFSRKSKNQDPATVVLDMS